MNILAIKRKERGEITSTDIDPFLSLTTEELLCLLNSPTPSSRTCAATLLSDHKTSKVVMHLCQRLILEKKLYCNIAICNALVNIGSLSVAPLIALLGKIRKNQETVIPQKGFNKISYPLPRDIAARTLCRMGNDILPELLTFLESTKLSIEREQTIDAIGHLIYTNQLKIDSKKLLQIAAKHSTNKMIQYKIIRCLSGFKDNQVKQFLYKRLQSPQIGLQFETARSLMLSGIGLPNNNLKIPEKVASFARQLTDKIQTNKSRQRK